MSQKQNLGRNRKAAEENIEIELRQSELESEFMTSFAQLHTEYFV